MKTPVLLLLLLLARLPGIPGEKYDPTSLVFPTRMHIPIRKATKFHLFLYVQNRVKVRDPQGIAVTRLDSWEDPNTEKDDDELTIYGVNSGQNVIIFNSSMTSISMYGLNERGEQQLDRPHGITATRQGIVYVADTGKDRVVKLYNPGNTLRFRKSLLQGRLRRPRDVATTEDGALYVADTGNDRLLRVLNDTLHSVIAGPDRLSAPAGVAAISADDRWSFWKEAFVVVIDCNGQRLQKFDPGGELLAGITAREFGYPDAELQYAAIDYYSNIWVTDKRHHCVHKFDRSLRYLDSFGRRGTGDKEFIEPRGIDIYRRFGQVLIAEKEAAQYYWIGTDVKNLRTTVDENGLLRIDYFLTERSYVTLEIEDERGLVVATPLKEVIRPPGDNTEYFTGHWQAAPQVFRDGRRVLDESALTSLKTGDGRNYTLRFTFSATYSSYKYFSKTLTLTARF